MGMQKFFSPVCVAVLVICSIYALPVAASGTIKITEMAVTTKIHKGNPIDSVRRISSASVKTLYCFTRLTATSDADTTIKHVWYKNDEVAGEYELPVKGKHWRTYSSKQVEKGAAGDWRVEAQDAEGNVLKVVKFRMN